MIASPLHTISSSRVGLIVDRCVHPDAHNGPSSGGTTVRSDKT
jgi:hypothetical protein